MSALLAAMDQQIALANAAGAEEKANLQSRSGVAHLDPAQLHSGGTPVAENSASACATRHVANFDWLYGNEYLSDVCVRIGGGKFNVPAEGKTEVVQCHKCVLATHSTKYRAMFEDGTWQESSMKEVDMFYTLESCRCVLRHIYCCDYLVTLQNALEVLDAAVLYNLPLLRQETVKFLTHNISRETVFDFLNAALLYQEKALRGQCVAFVRKTNLMRSVLHSDALFDIPKDVLLILIEEAVIDSDFCILQRLHAWCQHQLQGRESPNVTPSTDTLEAFGEQERIQQMMCDFWRLIDFTAMDQAEVQEVEALGIVPVRVLLSSFKSRWFAREDARDVVRRGAIRLQWDDSSWSDVESVDSENHLKKSEGSDWRCVSALNKFSEGTHYWVFTLHGVATAPDSLVGVAPPRQPLEADPMQLDAKGVVFFDISANEVHAPGGNVIRCQTLSEALVPNQEVDLGVQVDFARACVSFVHHTTNTVMFRVEYDVALAPLSPFAAVRHVSNPGLTLSETTTFPKDSFVKTVCTTCGVSKSPTLRSPKARRVH